MPDVYETFVADSDENEKIELNDAKETLKIALHLEDMKRIPGINGDVHAVPAVPSRYRFAISGWGAFAP